MECVMTSKFQKVVGVSAVGAVSVLELLNLQPATAAPVNFLGNSVSYTAPGGTSTVQVQITVDVVGGIYKMTAITTPVQPSGGNASFGAFAIPPLTTAALNAQSANINVKNTVSGATLVGNAWVSSLSSAIAKAAAAGETIGTAVTGNTPTPTPAPSGTPTVTPTPTPTPKPSPTTSGTKHRSYGEKREDSHSKSVKGRSHSEDGMSSNHSTIESD